jgi:antibiotic biosynthesis monooxygenase (ABM) superfamily enzyme
MSGDRPPSSETATPSVSPEALSSPVESSSLVNHLLERRPEVRKRLLVWSGVFVVVFGLFLLVANFEDLRMFDPVFLPALFLLILVTLIYGYVIGSARGLRYCLRWMKKKLE